MPATEDENHLRGHRKVERLMKVWQAAQARISVQRCRLSKSQSCSGHCLWDLIRNAAKPKSVFNCETSDVCILHGGHRVTDPFVQGAAQSVHEAKNAAEVLRMELTDTKDTNFKDDPHGMHRFFGSKPTKNPEKEEAKAEQQGSTHSPTVLSHRETSEHFCNIL